MWDNGTAADKDTGGSVRVRRSFGILGRGPILTYHLPIRQEGSRVDIIGCIVMSIIGGIANYSEDLHVFVFLAFDMYQNYVYTASVLASILSVPARPNSCQMVRAVSHDN